MRLCAAIFVVMAVARAPALAGPVASGLSRLLRSRRLPLHRDPVAGHDHWPGQRPQPLDDEPLDGRRHHHSRAAAMIRIAISQAAFEVIARTLPFGSMSFENKTDQNGDRLIWLERRMLDKLNSHRRAGESYSDVILRVAAESA